MPRVDERRSDPAWPWLQRPSFGVAVCHDHDSFLVGHGLEWMGRDGRDVGWLPIIRSPSPRGHVVMSLGIKGGISRLSCVSRALPITPSIHVFGYDVTQGPGTSLCYLIGWNPAGRAPTSAARY